MGIVKGLLKVGASAVLAATGTASTVLKGMSDTVGLNLGSELFGAVKDASFNGIRNMWDMESPQEEEYATEEEAKQAAIDKEIHKLKVQALRCKDMAEKATNEDMRQRFMDQHDSLWEQATELANHRYDEE